MPGFRRGKRPGNAGKRYSQDVVPREEMQLLLTTPSRTSATGKRNRAMIGVMYRAGLRVGCELLRLQMTDLDLTSRSVHVAKGKNGKARIVPMDEYGWELLAPWLVEREKISAHGPVFCTIAKPVTGGPLASSSVRKMLKDACVFSGITRRITPHTLRHTFASELLSEGVELLVISHMLGHSNIATTNIYVNHLPSDKLREAIAARPRPGVEA
jgi:integrase/recombinase XerD